VSLPLIIRAQEHNKKIAIATATGSFSYQDLMEISGQIATRLLEGNADLQEQRVVFLIPSGFEYVATQWAIWRAGGMAVPLCVSHPRPELEYVIKHSGATIAVIHPSFADLFRPIAAAHPLRVILTSEPLPAIAALPDVDIHRRALMLYTSGTTGKPKGVVMTHHTIQAQVESLVTAWDWTERDRILHVLPLHHIHGIINVLTCALWAGATCQMLSKFDAEAVWEEIATGDLTLFMAVPTIYVKLISAWQAAPSDRQKTLSTSCAKLRLMVSGSAALPVQVLEKWQHISGHFLLERYGMTEIGMALSNPLQGQRQAGSVGTPLPGVEVRLVDESGAVVPPGTPGEIQVKGDTVFLDYWHNPDATAKTFRDRWFCTGDWAIVEDGNYRILGRISVDIIKTGGYKVSALEIEETLRTHPKIQDCAVVGVTDPEWGERVCAAIVLRSQSDSTVEALNLTTLRHWAKKQLAVYKVPTRILTIAELPRNAMGKVTKPAVVELFRSVERGVILGEAL
jgi:malonyl-CoA/methylmalonyl-CoA synthetase